MTIKSKAKGTRAEYACRDLLKKYTGLPWNRTPQSGALGAQFKMKADLFVPGEKNLYSVEVKSYKDDHLASKILVNTTSPLFDWWEQVTKDAKSNGNEPILIYKYDRSKFFLCTDEIYDAPNHIYISSLNIFVYPLEQFLQQNNIKEWIK